MIRLTFSTAFACTISFLMAPLANAQHQNFASVTAPLADDNAVVTVHQLEIPQKARAFCNKGTKDLAANDPEHGAREFQKAIKAFPDYFEAYTNLGAAEIDMHRWDEAAAAFRKSIELSHGHYAPANFGLGLILSSVQQNFSDAEAVVRQGLQTAPTSAAGNYVLGWVLYSTNRLTDAEKSAREALVFEPEMGAAWLLLAQIHIRENKAAEVADDLDTYLTLGGSSPINDKVRAIRAQALNEVTAQTASVLPLAHPR
jgi:tetratricopeptide (TPR) repeat protein